eukprot:1160330-Pelagomonas_calceolata.AAC.4
MFVFDGNRKLGFLNVMLVTPDLPLAGTMGYGIKHVSRLCVQLRPFLQLHAACMTAHCPLCAVLSRPVYCLESSACIVCVYCLESSALLTASNGDLWAISEGHGITSLESLPPTSSCELIMMVGLPGSGKSTWAQHFMLAHPEKRYMLLGPEMVLDQMRLSLTKGLTKGKARGGLWRHLALHQGPHQGQGKARLVEAFDASPRASQRARRGEAFGGWASPSVGTRVAKTSRMSAVTSQAPARHGLPCKVLQRGTFLGSTTTEAVFPYIGGGREGTCIDHAYVLCVKYQGKSGVWEGREGCSDRSAQVANWTDGLHACLALLGFLASPFASGVMARLPLHYC